jgi:hypothetical protein
MKAKIGALLLATTALVSCTPTQFGVRRDSGQELPPANLNAGANGQTLAAKRCNIRVASLVRPLGDPVLNEVIWRVADEQAVPDDLRRSLNANGIRIGLIPSTLPGEVTEILNAPPPNQVEPTIVNVPSGQYSMLPVGLAAKKLSLILNLGGTVSGRDYSDAHGFLRLTASHDRSGSVALRFVPNCTMVQSSAGSHPTRPQTRSRFNSS